MEQQLKTNYEIKTTLLGPIFHHEKKMKILNRIVSWEQDGIKYEADPRHVEIMAQQLGLEDNKTITTPGNNDEGRTTEDCNQPLDWSQETMYRAFVARANYLSPERPDIAYAVKKFAKAMSSPNR